MYILYKSYVRPVLDYASVIWSPYTATYINKIERVQRRMSRMIAGIQHLQYNDRLDDLRLLSLQARRKRFQLITVFKMIHKLMDCDFNRYFKIQEETRTRGHRMKLFQKYSKYGYRQHFFTNSCVHLWNLLTEDVVNVSEVSQFKNNIEALVRSKFP